MNNSKLAGAIGFSMKSGKCASGEFAADKAVKASKAYAVLVDVSASAATKKRWSGRCEAKRIPYVEVENLGGIIGKEARMVAAITDAAFSGMITRAYSDNNEIDHGGASNGES